MGKAFIVKCHIWVFAALVCSAGSSKKVDSPVKKEIIDS